MSRDSASDLLLKNLQEMKDAQTLLAHLKDLASKGFLTRYTHVPNNWSRKQQIKVKDWEFPPSTVLSASHSTMHHDMHGIVEDFQMEQFRIRTAHGDILFQTDPKGSHLSYTNRILLSQFHGSYPSRTLFLEFDNDLRPVTPSDLIEDTWSHVKQ